MSTETEKPSTSSKSKVVVSKMSTSLFAGRKKRLVLGLVAVVVLVVLGLAGYAAWRYVAYRKSGAINAATYSWPTTEKGTVKDATKNMNDQQKAEYFYSVAFEYKNKNKPDDAQAAIKVSLQYHVTEKGLLLAAGLAEARSDFTAAANYYQELIQIITRKGDAASNIRVEQYKRRIEDLRKLKPKPATPLPAKNGSQVSA